MDVFSSLLSGATLYPFDLAAVSPDETVDWLLDNRITVFHSLPPVFRRVARGLKGANALPDVRVIDVAGEPLLSSDVELFRQRFAPSCVLVNHLAMTEASVAAQLVIDHCGDLPSSPIPVGYTADGIEMLVCDDCGNSLPALQTGELIVKSAYASPGYWNDEVLTNAAFSESIEDPDTRLYRTGDLGRRSPRAVSLTSAERTPALKFVAIQ